MAAAWLSCSCTGNEKQSYHASGNPTLHRIEARGIHDWAKTVGRRSGDGRETVGRHLQAWELPRQQDTYGLGILDWSRLAFASVPKPSSSLNPLASVFSESGSEPEPTPKKCSHLPFLFGSAPCFKSKRSISLRLNPLFEGGSDSHAFCVACHSGVSSS